MATLIGLLVFVVTGVVFFVFGWAIDRMFGKDGPTVIINTAAILAAAYLLWMAADDIGTSAIGLFT